MPVRHNEMDSYQSTRQISQHYPNEVYFRINTAIPLSQHSLQILPHHPRHYVLMCKCVCVCVCVCAHTYTHTHKHIQDGPWEADNFKLAILGRQPEKSVQYNARVHARQP